VEENSKVRAVEAVKLPKASPKWPIMPCGQTRGIVLNISEAYVKHNRNKYRDTASSVLNNAWNLNHVIRRVRSEEPLPRLLRNPVSRGHDRSARRYQLGSIFSLTTCNSLILPMVWILPRRGWALARSILWISIEAG
jgi:hypothetical protein